MGMNQTPSGNRIHIGFFGRRNAGKSSLVNAVTGQEVSVVSEMKGTTTDPVYKTMEWLPLGPVMIIDTPGFDDEGTLGELRIQKTKQVLNRTDIAVLVIDSICGMTTADKEMIDLFNEKEIPYLVVWNKTDLVCTENDTDCEQSDLQKMGGDMIKPDSSEEKCSDVKREIRVSALTTEGVEQLKEVLPGLVKVQEDRFRIVGDLLKPLDLVVLVVPIDSAAPKGRLILPQQQVIRDILEAGAVSIVVKDTEYKQLLDKLEQKPRLVITDSQVFKQISRDTPEDIELTSFSILMARKKGFLKTAVEGVQMLEKLKDGDRILIAEGCTHHRQCEDIGTVKLPRWIQEYTSTKPQFSFCSGMEFPEDLSAYKLIIHCGGCMQNEKEMRYRMKCAMDQKVPFTNYGIVIAQMNHILERSLYALNDVF